MVVFFIPAFQRIGVGVGADVGDFNADGAGVGDRGVPGAFLEIERLVNRAVEVEHEMDTEAAVIVQDFEALAAGAGGIVVDDELIHFALEGE